MTLSIFKFEREIGEIKYIHMSLQLIDRTTIIPEGIVKDVLVQMDKFIFPVNLIMVNIEENKEVALILERPSLVTSKYVLDIHEGELMLREGEKRVVFKMNKAMRTPREESVVYSDLKADVLKELAEEDNNDKCGGTRRSQRRKF